MPTPKTDTKWEIFIETMRLPPAEIDLQGRDNGHHYSDRGYLERWAFRATMTNVGINPPLQIAIRLLAQSIGSNHWLNLDAPKRVA